MPAVQGHVSVDSEGGTHVGFPHPTITTVQLRIYRFAGCDHMNCRCGHSFNWRQADRVGVGVVPSAPFQLPAGLFRRVGGGGMEGISNAPFDAGAATVQATGVGGGGGPATATRGGWRWGW